MADDIVTRLRWKAPMGCWSDGEEAADEIERLRAAGDVVASMLDRCSCNFDGNPCPCCAARNEWQEARRGDR